MNGYIYIRNHSSYNIYDACKMGKTINIIERDGQYATGEIKRGYFEVIFEVSSEKMDIIEKLLQNEFNKYNIRYDGGTEFYNKKIITLIEPYLIKLGIEYKRLGIEEINNLVRRDKKPIWYERDYQKTIIEYSKNELILNNKIYIELPTGAGKSYIAYNLLNYLKSDFIIIISPRKIVNLQNISVKYLNILSDKYDIFDYSTDKHFKLTDKKILTCCTQSSNKLYKFILSNKITNLTVWFDEAHWGIEDWIDSLSDNKTLQFWLLDNIHIKYRLFTSASPNKQKILQNKNIFGELYSAIKVKELIDLNWLSSIKVYIYSENIDNIDNINHIITDFNDTNRKFGFSYHNKQKNAFNLFYNHYLRYKEKLTYIKPFLLVSDNFSIKKDDITLEYNYRDIKTFETTIYSIGYVVAKYSIGYDFNKLDYMCISDPKLSIQDIKQCIGRGIRSDELGEYGSNKEKILNISLPLYIDNSSTNKYEKILEVLKYLLYDIEISFEEIEFKNRYNINANKETKTNNYDGINNVKSKLLNLLELDNKKMTYEKARKIIADKNIKSKKSYYELCESDNRLTKEPEIVFKGQFTNWIEYLSIERVYYDLEICKNKIGEYLLLYPEIKKDHLDLSNISNELCKIDALFPPNDLWLEYYDVKDLHDIITITNKKKKIGVIL